MLKNYFLVAWRGLRKNRVFSVINIAGLAIGLGVCMLITLYVTHELSYDRYNVKADRIYRLDADLQVGDMGYFSWDSPLPMGPALVKDFPDVETMARVNFSGTMSVKKGDQTLLEERAGWADASLFDVFTLPMLAGDPKTALAQPNTMVISEKMAKKYFGSIAGAMGQSMVTDNSRTVKVTGVMRDIPETSHFHLDFIRSLVTQVAGATPEWLNNNVATYVLVRPGVSKAQLVRDLRAAVLKYIQPELQSALHAGISDLEAKGSHYQYKPIPITRIHLYSDLTNEVEPLGNVQYVYIFIAAGVLILLLACVNFMNLSTARSAGRAREVGVRKVLGSQRGQLVWQFLVESLVTCGLALVLGLALAVLALPYLNGLAGVTISWNELPWAWLAPGIIGLMVVVGLAAGSYPAFFLSAFQPSKVLKGDRGLRWSRTRRTEGRWFDEVLAKGLRGLWVRNALVVFQFATAVILIVGTLTIYSQLRYMQNRKLGYHREQVAVISNMGALWVHARTFEDEVLKMPGVVSTTMASIFPTSTDWNINVFSRDASMSQSQTLSMGRWFVDARYIPTLGMEMEAGRNFSPVMPTDSGAVIINETAAHLLGFGKPLEHILYMGTDPGSPPTPFRIIGVVKDFSAGSMRNKVKPIVLMLQNQVDKMAVRVKTDDLPKLMAGIEAKYHAVVPEMAGQPFVYTFMDEDFNRLYVSEQRTGRLFVSFAAFAILIACLGLFGLVSYAAEQRMKEIGIRKVLGASVGGIVGLLSRELIGLVLVAVLVASPVAWWLGHWWLGGFAYRASMGVWVFGVAAVVAVGIAFVTAGVQAVRAARANPAASLKNE
jgi:putative ABC transport system permease protein